jgi:phospholipid-binding lipoprotein MlaA
MTDGSLRSGEGVRASRLEALAFAAVLAVLACASPPEAPAPERAASGIAAAPAAAESAGTATSAAPAAGDPLAGEDALLEDELLLEEDDAFETPVSDPLEPGNRAVFSGNEFVYRWAFDPISRAYRWAVPDPARRAVRRFFANLNLPADLVNDLLQLRPRRAASTGARFLVNSSVGVVGLFDPAARLGLEADSSDFGETLGVHGIPAGPYLVIPLLGPSTARDAVGSVVDAVMRPDFWLLVAGPYIFLLTASDGISFYEGQQIHMDELRRSSVDFYAALRSAYAMNRAAEIREARLR